MRVNPAPSPARSPAWESVAAEAIAVTSLDADSPPSHFFRLVVFRYLTQLRPTPKRASLRSVRSLGAATELTRRIRSDFVYDPKATKVDTPAAVAFDRRRGVCQDFAHIMIAAVRGIALPALYVSGYIRTIPPPGKERLAGADASHAWVSLWCGATLGWRDFDPTNGTSIQNDHIVVARGRDYSDVSPIESMVLSSGRPGLEVEVDVIPGIAGKVR